MALPETQQDIAAWIAQKSKQYGGKKAFLVSEEYRLAYPRLVQLHQENKEASSSEREAAMFAAGIRYGDRVDYVTPLAFGQVEHLFGEVVKHKGYPQVRLDTGFHGRRYVLWNRGWKKSGIKRRLLR